jgi:hypothetical protein
MSPRPTLPCEVRIVTGGGEVGAAKAELVSVRAIGRPAAAIATAMAIRRHRRTPFLGAFGEGKRGIVLLLSSGLGW